MNRDDIHNKDAPYSGPDTFRTQLTLKNYFKVKLHFFVMVLHSINTIYCTGYILISLYYISIPFRSKSVTLLLMNDLNLVFQGHEGLPMLNCRFGQKDIL